MNRRGFLGMLAGIPLIGRLFHSQIESSTTCDSVVEIPYTTPAFCREAGACRKCELLTELFYAGKPSPRLYWVMTELFVYLHGSDVCSEGPVTEKD